MVEYLWLKWWTGQYLQALSHNVKRKLIEDLKIGDEAFYERDDLEERHGPAKVTTIEGKVVEIKHGQSSLRVHTVYSKPRKVATKPWSLLMTQTVAVKLGIRN